jgi:hypothetical protein
MHPPNRLSAPTCLYLQVNRISTDGRSTLGRHPPAASKGSITGIRTLNPHAPIAGSRLTPGHTTGKHSGNDSEGPAIIAKYAAVCHGMTVTDFATTLNYPLRDEWSHRGTCITADEPNPAVRLAHIPSGHISALLEIVDEALGWHAIISNRPKGGRGHCRLATSPKAGRYDR